MSSESSTPPWSLTQRRPSRQIMVGKVPVGGGAPITVQSMTITKTADVEGTLQQIYALAAAGCDIVRCTCNEIEAAEGLAQIIPRSPVPIIVTLTSKMKRMLADEENSMLTYLQGKKAAVALEKLLPEPAMHVQGYVEAVAEDVMSAAMGGAKSLSSSLKADLRRKVTSSAVMQVMSKNIDDVLVRPLRDRIQRCVEQSDGDREEMSKLIRSVYREWKMQRVEQHIGDIARLAYSRGAYLVLDQGTSVCWMVDPNGPPCADAEDNSLAGATALGADFPTGHSHPIAHSGCRCLVTPIGE